MTPGAENPSGRSGQGAIALRLSLIGPFALSGPVPLTVTSRKNRAMLAILALSPGMRGAFWFHQPRL